LPSAARRAQPSDEARAPETRRCDNQDNAGAGIPASINENQFNQHVAERLQFLFFLSFSGKPPEKTPEKGV
jgi:hypothetical protein